MSSLAAQRKTAGNLGFQKLPWVVVLGTGTSAVRMWLEAGVHAPDARPKPHVRAMLPPTNVPRPQRWGLAALRTRWTVPAEVEESLLGPKCSAPTARGHR
jgi:hypothetical protein